MCLNPLKIYNPTKKISLFGGQKYQLEIPCGQCAECREARRTDIYFRSYYECEYTWSKNGYVYFDTLTYSTPNLPHISDFCYKVAKNSNVDYSCFNNEDFRLFMVRLRRQLEYHGFNCKDNLKYFVASEYGSDAEYVDDSGKLRKGTNRPHYHVLFFVTGDIDPITFSQYVNKCWQKGVTDGVDYKGSRYVLDHTFGPRYNSDQVHMRAVCNYVAKYVLKDSEFEDTLQKRIMAVFNNGILDEDSYLQTYAGKQYLKHIMKYMRPYTKWSNGFGVYGLDYNSDQDMYNNKMKVPDANQIWRFAPLSGYLSRKKYYEVQYDDNGKLYWRLNSEGKQRAFDSQLRGVEQFADRFREWMMNIDTLMLKSDDDNITTQDIYKFRKNLTNKIVKYLGDRTPEEFAFYVMFYKGRVKSMAQLERENNGVFVVDDVIEFFQKGLLCKEDIDKLNTKYIKYNYVHSTDARHFQERIIGNTKLDCEVDGVKGYNYLGFSYGYDINTNVFRGSFVDNYNKCFVDKFEKAEDWAARNCVNENSDPRFKDFDKLYSLYVSSLYYTNKRKQETYDYIEDMKKRLKNAGFYSGSL